MKSRSVVTSVMLLALAAFSAYARMTTSVHVTVPFEFSVNNQVLPAGEYLIGDSGTTGAAVLTILGDSGGHAVYFLGNPVYRDGALDQSSVVFHRYGTSYFLAGISWGDGHPGVDVLESKTEKELAKTASLRRPEKVVLVASR